MFDLSSPNSFWLNVVNFIAALILAASLFFAGRAVYKAGRVWFKKRIHLTRQDQPYMVSSLGITMADGGSRIDGRSVDGCDNSVAWEDEANIFRSEN